MLLRRLVLLTTLSLSGCLLARMAVPKNPCYPVEKRRGGVLGLVQDYIARADVEGALGCDRLALCNELYVRHILKRMGLAKADRIRIRRFNDNAKNWLGEKNACAVAYFYLPHYLYFSEEWLNTLNEKKRRFLVGHEAAHLKCRHQQKRYAASFAFIVAWVAAVESIHQAAGRWVPALRRSVYRLAAELGCLGALSAVLSKFMRAQEKEADLKAADNLDAAAGGIALVREWQADEEELLAEMSPSSRLLYRVLDTLRSPFRTHPTFAQRLSYLQACSQRNVR